MPGVWGKTVNGLRCRITELSLTKQRFTIEIQNQSDKPIPVITAPKSGWPESIGLEWAFYDPGKPPKWQRFLWTQSEPVEPGHAVLQPGKNHYRTSRIGRTPGSRFKVRYARFIETGAVELPTSVSVTFAGSSRSIREDEDILEYAEWFGLNMLRGLYPNGRPPRSAFVDPRLKKAARELKDIPRPWTVTAILERYRAEVKQPKLNDSRLGHLILVLAASRDPRAAVVLRDLPGVPRITRYTRPNLNHTAGAVTDGLLRITANRR